VARARARAHGPSAPARAQRARVHAVLHALFDPWLIAASGRTLATRATDARAVRRSYGALRALLAMAMLGVAHVVARADGARDRTRWARTDAGRALARVCERVGVVLRACVAARDARAVQTGACATAVLELASAIALECDAADAPLREALLHGLAHARVFRVGGGADRLCFWAAARALAPDEGIAVAHGRMAAAVVRASDPQAAAAADDDGAAPSVRFSRALWRAMDVVAMEWPDERALRGADPSESARKVRARYARLGRTGRPDERAEPVRFTRAWRAHVEADAPPATLAAQPLDDDDARDAVHTLARAQAGDASREGAPCLPLPTASALHVVHALACATARGRAPSSSGARAGALAACDEPTVSLERVRRALRAFARSAVVNSTRRFPVRGGGAALAALCPNVTAEAWRRLCAHMRVGRPPAPRAEPAELRLAEPWCVARRFAALFAELAEGAPARATADDELERALARAVAPLVPYMACIAYLADARAWREDAPASRKRARP
jgi:hypothetical protein